MPAEETAIETRGLEPVPDGERGGRVRELFPTWVAANISVLLLTMGAGLVIFNGLNIWQVLVVAVAAPVVSYGSARSGRRTCSAPSACSSSDIWSSRPTGPPSSASRPVPPR